VKDGAELMGDYDTAPEYTGRFSDNEYLHYINGKLAYCNARLDRLVTAIWFTNGLLMGLLGILYRQFGGGWW
jgi:hypothetical protein